MLHGPQRKDVRLTFSIPSLCAEQVEQDIVQIGLAPVAEIARQHLDIVPGVGIAAQGAVRSILLFTKVPWTRIGTLAADLSSRTSVQLARIVLRERFGIEPEVTRAEPKVNRMLEDADAALVIGDPALRIDPKTQPYEWLDLGAEWFEMTGLPFVFAAWAGKRGIPVEALQRLTIDSYEFGKLHLDEIVEAEYQRREIPKELADQYLRSLIRFELGQKEYEAMKLFFDMILQREATAGARV